MVVSPVTKYVAKSSLKAAFDEGKTMIVCSDHVNILGEAIHN